MKPCWQQVYYRYMLIAYNVLSSRQYYLICFKIRATLETSSGLSLVLRLILADNFT